MLLTGGSEDTLCRGLSVGEGNRKMPTEPSCLVSPPNPPELPLPNLSARGTANLSDAGLASNSRGNGHTGFKEVPKGDKGMVPGWDK